MTDVEYTLSREREEEVASRMPSGCEHDLTQVDTHPSMGRALQCRLCKCWQWEFPLYRGAPQ